MTTDIDRDSSLARSREFGIDEDTAGAVFDAFARVGELAGRRYDPAAWTKTVWLAEADRYRRSPDPDRHLTLLLHLEKLRQQWEAKAERGVRGWSKGPVGKRLTKR